VVEPHAGAWVLRESEMMSKTKTKPLPQDERLSLPTDPTVAVRNVAPVECVLGGGPERGAYQTPEQCRDGCEEEIRHLAYQKWEESGCPSGDGFDFWVEAEREVLSRLQSSEPARA
jgi:Protein of unknown function (DUF2934)